MDAKRSVLLFSKGVILVEGDGEEILFPAMIRKAFGVTLDELGVGLINIGSVGFANVACVFDDNRVQRHCSIVTDMDKIMPWTNGRKAVLMILFLYVQMYLQIGSRVYI